MGSGKFVEKLTHLGKPRLYLLDQKQPNYTDKSGIVTPVSDENI